MNESDELPLDEAVKGASPAPCSLCVLEVGEDPVEDSETLDDDGTTIWKEPGWTVK